MFPGDLHDLMRTDPDPAHLDRVECAFLAQLAPGETPEDLEPSRFATIAFRAVLLAEIDIDWRAELRTAVELGADRVKDLALRLATGEIDPRACFRELSDREASLACRAGGIFLTELARLVELAEAMPPEAYGLPPEFSPRPPHPKG